MRSLNIAEMIILNNIDLMHCLPKIPASFFGKTDMLILKEMQGTQNSQID
jgi:hypothetical protein